MTNPTLVMLDEPMAGVNPALKQSLNEHVRGLRDEGMTVLFVEHDMDMVHDISDWVVVMAEGRVIAEGTPDDIAAQPGGDRRLPRRPPGPVAARGGARMSDDQRATGSDRREPGETRRRRPTCRSAKSSSAVDLVAGYIPEVNILNGCNLVVNAGEFVGIIGPNGAGKSTLLKAILGLCTIRSGSVQLGDRDITGHKAHELVALGVGYVPQTTTCSRR